MYPVVKTGIAARSFRAQNGATYAYAFAYGRTALLLFGGRFQHRGNDHQSLSLG